MVDAFSSKDEWKLKVLGIAWTKEDEDYKNSCQHTFMYKVIDNLSLFSLYGGSSRTYFQRLRLWLNLAVILVY